MNKYDGVVIKKSTKVFTSMNILETTVEHNGCQGGDAGHGGFVRITFKDVSSTSMEVNGVECEEFSFEFKGSTERDTLVESLEMILTELKNNKFL